jgi:hypothetical protein
LKVAPIIHTRTFSRDFNSKFLVKPSIFFDSDIEWTRKNVQGATEQIDTLQGFRWLVVDNEKYRIAGVVGFLQNIYSEIENSLSENDKLKSKELFCDEKNRLVYAFIGVVIDKCNNNNYGTISLDYLWNVYFNKVYPIWKGTSENTIFENFENIEVKLTDTTITEKAINVGSKEFFESNAKIDYELFSYFLCNEQKKNFSFCSNLSSFNVVKRSEFSVITTSKNIITRIKRENISNSNSISNEQKLQVDYPTNNYEISQKSKNEKKNFLPLIIGLMTLLIIILMSILMVNAIQ